MNKNQIERIARLTAATSLYDSVEAIKNDFGMTDSEFDLFRIRLKRIAYKIISGTKDRGSATHLFSISEIIDHVKNNP